MSKKAYVSLLRRIAAAHIEGGVHHNLVCSRDALNEEFENSKTYQEFFYDEAKEEIIKYIKILSEIAQVDVAFGDRLLKYEIDLNSKGEEAFKGMLWNGPYKYDEDERKNRLNKTVEHLFKAIENKLNIINMYEELARISKNREISILLQKRTSEEVEKLAVLNHMLVLIFEKS